MTKVLYISYDGMTDPLGQSQVIPYLIGLSAKGYEITILSSEKQENYFRSNDKISELLIKNKINWNSISYTKKPPVLSTIWDIINLHRSAKKLQNKNKFTIVHCRSYISSLVGLFLKKKYGVKFIFDMRGFFADERVDGKIWDLKNPVYKSVFNYFKKKEIEFLQNADYTVSLTNAGKNIIHSLDFFKIIKPQIAVIPCCADLEHFSAKNIDQPLKEKYQKELNISENDFIISYLGSLGTWYMADEMMQFFKQLLSHNPQAKFLFISKDKPGEIIALARKYAVDIKNIIIQGAERNEVPTLLSLSKISLFFIKPVFSKKASSPTKMAEILGMGIPVICNANVGDVDEIMANNPLGDIVNNFTNNEFERVISNIDSILNIPKEKLTETAVKLFSLQIGVEKYFEVYKKITGN